jgi:hypothetical protein
VGHHRSYRFGHRTEVPMLGLRDHATVLVEERVEQSRRSLMFAENAGG